MQSSELRRDVVSGDWVVIATGRAKRPHAFQATPRDASYTKIEGCPFENPQASGNGPPVLAYDRRGRQLGAGFTKQWFVQVIPNKYPALVPGVPKLTHRNLVAAMNGAGFHELVIMRDHTRHWAHFSPTEAETVMRAYRERYRVLSRETIVQYVSMFHNFGREAGASLYHPHSQVLAIPVIPPDVGRSFAGSTRYYHSHGRCVHCDMISWEKKKRLRVVLETKDFIVFCPFASHTAFEVRLFPKTHQPCFAELPDAMLSDAGNVLRRALGKISSVLHDPSYNFFFHTSPCGKDHLFPHYHWHIEILPKVSIGAGFEIATGIDISTVAPEKAAALLRRV